MSAAVRPLRQPLTHLARSLRTLHTPALTSSSTRRISTASSTAPRTFTHRYDSDTKAFPATHNTRNADQNIQKNGSLENKITRFSHSSQLYDSGQGPDIVNMNFTRTHHTRPNPDAPWEWRQPPLMQQQQRGPAVAATASPALPKMQQQNKDKKKKKDERDLRTPPSLASGGIPDPTPAYQQLSALPPLALKEPRKLLVVIDLNGTLLHRPNKRHPSRFVERPHARQFLAYCIDVFHVVIWSSAKPANVASMCNQLLTGEQRSRVVAIWARDKFGLTPTDFVARTQCYKRLHVLWADPAVAASHPDAARGVRWSQQDTVLIDDSLEKARSERHNLVEIPEFVSSSDNDGAVATEVADILPQVHDYINECASQANVSAFIRERPFRALPTSQLLLGMASRPER